MAPVRGVTLLVALAAAAAAGSVRWSRQLNPASLPLLQTFVPQEPPALGGPVGQEVDRQSEGGFSPQIPDFRAGGSLPPADENSPGFFQMPPGFPNMASLSGFPDTFQDSANSVNNIDVPGIQFPASPFQTSRIDDEPQPVFQATPGGGN